MSITNINERPTPIVRAGQGPGVLFNRDPHRVIFIGRDSSIVEGNFNNGSILDPLSSLYVGGDVDIWACAEVGTTANNPVPVDYIHSGRSQHMQSPGILTEPLNNIVTGQTVINETLTNIQNTLSQQMGGLQLLGTVPLSLQTTSSQGGNLTPALAFTLTATTRVLLIVRVEANSPFSAAQDTSFWVTLRVTGAGSAPLYLATLAQLSATATGGGASYNDAGVSGVATVSLPAGTYSPQISFSASASGWQILGGEFTAFAILNATGTPSPPVPPPVPTPVNPVIPGPSDFGFIAWTVNPMTVAVTTTLSLASGTLFMVPFYAAIDGVINNIRFYSPSGAATPPVAANFNMGIYDGVTAAPQIGSTPDIGPTLFPSASTYIIPFQAPVTVTAGKLYTLAFLRWGTGSFTIGAVTLPDASPNWVIALGQPMTGRPAPVSSLSGGNIPPAGGGLPPTVTAGSNTPSVARLPVVVLTP